MQATRSHRGLSTARAALSVTWLLARTPDGVRADEVAHELGKSVSTAYNLLASLCDEGVAERLPGGLYHLSDEFRETVAEESDRHDLSRRRRRPAGAHAQARLPGRAARQPAARRARARPAGDAEAAGDEPGDQRQRARAGARQDRARPRPRRRARALPAAPASSASRRTRSPIPTCCAPTCGACGGPGSPPTARRSRRDFCCIAAPLLDEQRRFLGAVGISMSVRAFDNEREALTETLRDIVQFQACADRREVLDRGRTPVLASDASTCGRRLRQRRLHS